MKTKKNKKKNRKILVKLLIIIIVVLLIVLYVNKARVKNIYVVGNNYLKDQEIIELAGLENYPYLFKISVKSIENKIKMNEYISSVKVTKNIFGKVSIEVLEYNMLLKGEIDNVIYLSNMKTLANDNRVVALPVLINYTPDNILKEFLQKLDKIDKNILAKISEISYEPNEYDDDLFLFCMNDGNYVYITTKRLNNINKYDEVLVELEGKKGILYLDSGNHFQVLE